MKKEPTGYYLVNITEYVTDPRTAERVDKCMNNGFQLWGSPIVVGNQVFQAMVSFDI